jgi:hypothetical protein
MNCAPASASVFTEKPMSANPRHVRKWVALVIALATARAWSVAVSQNLATAKGSTVAGDSRSCLGCHRGIESMHGDGDMEIGATCVGCHGGNGNASDRTKAHVPPRNKRAFATSANPMDSYTVLNHESEEFIRFMNPGDLRVVSKTCGKCHGAITGRVLTSSMAHSAMIPQAGLYNNGIHDARRPVFGEAYLEDGTPARLTTSDAGSGPAKLPPDLAQTSLVGKLEPLPQFELVPATDPFRVLERGNNAAGQRGPGTDFHVAGGGIVLHKTRLNDPTLWFMGTNQTAGDYRNSGCTACHVLYANDRDSANAGPILAQFYRAGGKSGRSASMDQSAVTDERGHPVAHRMTTGVPVSQCLTCHHHQGNGAIGNYVGAVWWDGETDAAEVLPKKPGAYPSADELDALQDKNAALKDVQFADWHGHSWNFRNVYKMDRHGNLLDAHGGKIADDDPARFHKAVHLQDIHMEKGMHCIDCHTEQDVHGDGRLWGAMIDAIEIRCEDCHGSLTRRATLLTSGVAGSHNLADRVSGPRTPFGGPQFTSEGRRIIQHSKIREDLHWTIPQVVDMIDPESPAYNARAARAKTMRKDGTWGPVIDEARVAHADKVMECYTCHSAYNNSCYGCHLSADVNQKSRAIHFEGDPSRAIVSYNPQMLRSDAFLLGLNGASKGRKYSPMRSASAVVVTVRDRGRNQVVTQQPTISAAGYSGFAFTPNPPHTVRTAETKQCTDCHLSQANDNNAWMAAVLGMGTNGANFIGEYAYLALGNHGIDAVRVTEGREPQPVIGSSFHRLLHLESYKRLVMRGRRLPLAHAASSSNALDIQTRGEFVFVADGPGGLRVFDRANIANKGVAQPLVELLISPLGQKTRVPTRYATGIALPSTVPMNLDRPQRPENMEKPIAEIFRYAFVADRLEGLIVVDVNALHDGNPQNNYLRRAVTFNPENRLAGAVAIRVAGNYAYILSERSGLHVVDVSSPRAPKAVAVVPSPQIAVGRSLAIQFRYAFVTDREGVKVVDLTDPVRPRVTGATIPLADARGIYVQRTYAYVAAGHEGLVVLDIENPERPSLVEKFDANGQLNDATAVTTASVNASTFAFVADGKNGLRIVRLIEPAETPGHLGFSPKPTPALIASYRTRGPALAIAEGAKRDRAIDESGNQIGVAGRLGSRPLGPSEIDHLLRANGTLLTVKDE